MIHSLMQRKDKESLFVKKTLVFVVVFFLSLTINADNVTLKLTVNQAQFVISAQLELEELTVDSAVITTTVKFKRGKAILFTIFTGLFGGHRIYLGTHQRTPILYSITLGGLGILPLIDLVNIIFTKDISKFEGVPQIIMWGR